MLAKSAMGVLNLMLHVCPICTDDAPAMPRRRSRYHSPRRRCRIGCASSGASPTGPAPELAAEPAAVGKG